MCYSGLAWSYIIEACIAAYGWRWALRISALASIGVGAAAIALIRTPPTSRKLAKAGNWRDSFDIFLTERWLIPCVRLPFLLCHAMTDR